MKIEMNISKKYFCILFGVLVLSLLLIYVNAYNEGNPTFVGHHWNDIAGIPADIADGDQVGGGITAETDPVITWAILKDRGMPDGFKDGYDDGTNQVIEMGPYNLKDNRVAALKLSCPQNYENRPIACSISNPGDSHGADYILSITGDDCIIRTPDCGGSTCDGVKVDLLCKLKTQIQNFGHGYAISLLLSHFVP